MPMPISEKLILRQINHWNRLRELLKAEEPPAPRKRGPVITISRQAGSGGRLLAAALASRLGIELQDQSLVDRIARDRNLEKELVARLDEQVIDQAALWVEGVIKRRIFLKDEYHVALVKAISRLAARGGVVFLGRGAELILKENADLRIRLVASRQVRLANLQDRTGLSRAEARALMEENDRRRSEFIRSIFKVEPGRPEDFDLVLNADRMSVEQMTELSLLAMIQTQGPGLAAAAGS
ncbi:MAG: AAA family ATPase [Candidatus Krumholzibacteriia bacterium]